MERDVALDPAARGWDGRQAVDNSVGGARGRWSGKGLVTLGPGRWLRVALTVAALTLGGCTDFLGSGGDGGPPELMESNPASLAADVSVLSTFTLRFSSSLDPATLEEGILLRDGGGRLLRTDAALESKKTALLTPTDPLDFGVGYQLEITGSLASRSGEPLLHPDTLFFTTEGTVLPPVLADSLLQHVQALAHDSMRGREGGTNDELKAAHYVGERFTSYGLQPAPGGLIQPFQGESLKTGLTLDSRNVLAVVPGQGALSEEWIVVGAHYDHLGFHPVGGTGPARVYNGADDNASGTAVILEMARVYTNHLQESGMAGRDRRSVLFAAFGSEEHGLLGSWHYVTQDPAVPLSATAAMMNFDMVGRLRDGQAILFGPETSEVWEDLAANANVHSSSLTLIPWDACDYCSDHGYFMQRGIPIIWPYTMSHDEYHTPWDDVELLNVPGMASIGDWATRALSRLVVMPQAPVFR